MKQFLPLTRDWFSSNIGQPTPAQAAGWPAIAAGEDVLIAAPTGSGKTLAAFLYFLDGFRRALDAGLLKDGLSVLYISPLKALGNDIRENLTRPLAGLGLTDAVRVGVRSGDTTPRERRAMLRTPPHILISTPESLFLLLSSVSGREMLKGVTAVIVDEIHAVLSSKRGTHLFLSLARLDALTGRHVQRIGLSATVNPLNTAATHLTGGNSCVVVAPPIEKKTAITVESPLPDMRILPEHSIWPALAEKVTDALKNARTVLVFADGRASCERLAQQINAQAGGILARTHHGCVSKEQRLEAEQLLKSGRLRIMIATSSMELGIDVGEIDEVIQIGCPGSVAALIQRLGRAGHRPDRVSRMRIFPRTASEGLFCALTAAAASAGRIERAEPPKMCLDVLAQHLVSMAVSDRWQVTDATRQLRAAYPYRDLTEDTVRRVLAMLAGDDERAADHPVRARLIYDRIHDCFFGDDYTRMLALSSGGTIPDRGWFSVTLPDGTRLGELDEEYVFEARLGDKFLLGAFAWRITDILHDRVIVAPDTPAGAASPFWKGDRQMRAYETGKFFGACLETLDRAARQGEKALESALMSLCMSKTAAKNTARVIRSQLEAVGALATDRAIILEHFTDETGQAQLMIHSPFGGRVNRALTLLISAVPGALSADARIYDDDDGALIMLPGDRQFPRGLFSSLHPDGAPEKVCAALPASPMFSMVFRYNAARALLMGARSGRRQPLWIQRLRGAETLKTALTSPDHPMITETLHECAHSLLDLNALTDLLTNISAGRVKILEVHTETPSPLSLNLRRQAEADLMYVTPIPASATAHAAPAELTLAPDPAALPKNYARAYDAASAERVHELLLTVGDVWAEEVSAPLQFLEELESAGRALYIDPGLWIAAEFANAYRQALTEGDNAFFLPIVRRLVRYAGAQSVESVAERYAVPLDRAQTALDQLADEGTLIRSEKMYLHADNYCAAQRKTLALRRSAIRTAPGNAFAALLASCLYVPGSPAAQTTAALTALTGETYPGDAWESYLLPARVSAYRPALLDAALAHGEAVFRVVAPADGNDRSLPSGGKGTITRLMVSFHMPEDETDSALPAPETLSSTESTVYHTLVGRGASFARSLASSADESGISAVLQSLLLKGLVRADSFAPVRQFAKPAATLKASLRGRVQALDAGRWEAVRNLRLPDPEEVLDRLFARRLVVCRETAGSVWSLLLPVLRRMEYAGQARRGYFVEGLSGAQFVRLSDLTRVTMGLSAPGEDFCCLCAADPLQAWGLYLKHSPGREFVRLPSTVVVLRGGEPVCVWERQGQELRVFSEEHLSMAVSAFRDAFLRGAIFPAAARITVKRCPENAIPALEQSGFRREMLDYVLSRR